MVLPAERFCEIDLVYSLSLETGVPVEDIFAMRQAAWVGADQRTAATQTHKDAKGAPDPKTKTG